MKDKDIKAVGGLIDTKIANYDNGQSEHFIRKYCPNCKQWTPMITFPFYSPPLYDNRYRCLNCLELFVEQKSVATLVGIKDEPKD